MVREIRQQYSLLPASRERLALNVELLLPDTVGLNKVHLILLPFS